MIYSRCRSRPVTAAPPGDQLAFLLDTTFSPRVLDPRGHRWRIEAVARRPHELELPLVDDDPLFGALELQQVRHPPTRYRYAPAVRQFDQRQVRVIRRENLRSEALTPAVSFEQMPAVILVVEQAPVPLPRAPC